MFRTYDHNLVNPLIPSGFAQDGRFHYDDQRPGRRIFRRRNLLRKVPRNPPMRNRIQRLAFDFVLKDPLRQSRTVQLTALE